MDRKYILKHNVIERYLLDKLTQDLRDEFEQFYLVDQQTLDDLETAKRFLECLRNADCQDAD